MSTYIVFDLDETIGYFTQFGIIWESIEYLFENKLSQEYFRFSIEQSEVYRSLSNFAHE